MKAWLKKLERSVKQLGLFAILGLLIYEAVEMHVAGARNILLVILWPAALVSMAMPEIRGVDTWLPKWLIVLTQWAMVIFLVWRGEWWLAIPLSIVFIMVLVTRKKDALADGARRAREAAADH